MKKIYVFIAAIALLSVACRKDTGTDNTLNETKMNSQDETSNAPAPCSGNDWELDQDYPTHGIAMKYDNKIYVPDKASQTVSIFDGSNWTSIPSTVPLYTFINNVNSLDIVTFTIGNRGYILIPYNPELPQVEVIGFWEYNFTSNSWRRRADFPGIPRDLPSYFTIGTKGYIVGGRAGSLGQYINDTWEYNQTLNTWTQKASTGYFGRYGATGFSIGNKGYIVCGRFQSSNAPAYTKQLLEYDPSANDWTAKAVFPGQSRQDPVVFVISDKVYAGGGKAGTGYTLFQDYYKYNPTTNSWIRVADLPLAFRTFFGFSINSRGYAVLDFGSWGNGMVQYTPQYCFPGSSQRTVNGIAN